MTRLLAAVSARRALLGGSLAALALAALPGDQQDVAVGKPARRRTNRQQGRKRGGNGPRATPCTVCDDLDDCPFTSIQAAINAASAGATIVICEGTYKEDITISRNLTLAAQGRGPKNFELEGTGASTVVTVPAGVTATIQGLAIRGGAGTLNQGVRWGGGIYNSGTLSLSTVIVENNQLLQGSLGGGIYNDDGAELTVTAGSSISDNEADEGAGVYNSGTLTVSGGSEVAANEANGSGGGIFNNQGQVTIDEADVIGNTAEDFGDGGGIFNDSGSLIIRNNSVVADNVADGDGGGIANEPQSTVTVDQSRVSSNEADGRGGGIFNNLGTVVLQNASVVIDNGADDTGGGIFNTNGSVSLSGKSRVVDNKPNDCVGTNACTA